MSDREHLTVGIDPGSSAVKVAIVKSRAGKNASVLAETVQRIRRRNVADVVQMAFEEACATAGVGKKDFDYVASTGDGDAVTFRTGHFYSMTTHARGALLLDPEAQPPPRHRRPARPRPQDERRGSRARPSYDESVR
ncbi:MAG: BadF/BadG/BcrA/BcrD ATPase family protein [Polyangiaceae bacterium]